MTDKLHKPSRPISRRTFLRYTAAGVLGFSASALGGTAYATKIEPAAVEITRLTIPIAKLPSQFEGMTLVQVSDWHLGEWMTLSQMLSVAQQVNTLAPDVIMFTGDFLSRIHSNTYTEVTKAAGAFSAKQGIFATLGNHDFWTNATRATAAVEKADNTQLLLNKNTMLERNGAQLYIAGVNDIWEKQHDLKAALDGIPSDAPVILLAHEPDYADEVAKDGRVSLQLSGHSHGGQVRLPFKGALLLPNLGQKYDMGQYQIDNLTLYTNRGLGMVAPYVRFGCRPEITHITLVSKNV